MKSSMNNISFIDTAPDSNQIERAAKWVIKTVVVIITVNTASAIMYQSIPSLAIPPGQFFDGRIPHLRAKKSSKPPTPGL